MNGNKKGVSFIITANQVHNLPNVAATNGSLFQKLVILNTSLPIITEKLMSSSSSQPN